MALMAAKLPTVLIMAQLCSTITSVRTRRRWNESVSLREENISSENDREIQFADYWTEYKTTARNRVRNVATKGFC